jgi:hypothetical protein
LADVPDHLAIKINKSFLLFSFVTNYLEPVALLIYFIATYIYFKRKKTAAAKTLITYYLTVTLLQLYASYVVKFIQLSNIWVYDLVAFLTAAFIGYYFYQLLLSSAKKKTVLLLMGVYLAYAVYRQASLEGQRLFDSMGYAILSASIAIYVFMYFHQVLKNVTEISILKEFNFWLSSSYLLYYIGNFFVFVSYYYLTTKVINTLTKPQMDLLTALWGLHNVLLFLGALSLLTGSLWITYRKKSA